MLVLEAFAKLRRLKESGSQGSQLYLIDQSPSPPIPSSSSTSENSSTTTSGNGGIRRKQASDTTPPRTSKLPLHFDLLLGNEDIRSIERSRATTHSFNNKQNYELTQRGIELNVFLGDKSAAVEVKRIIIC